MSRVRIAGGSPSTSKGKLRQSLRLLEFFLLFMAVSISSLVTQISPSEYLRHISILSSYTWTLSRNVSMSFCRCSAMQRSITRCLPIQNLICSLVRMGRSIFALATLISESSLSCSNFKRVTATARGHRFGDLSADFLPITKQSSNVHIAFSILLRVTLENHAYFQNYRFGISGIFACVIS